jgi:HD-like signal output (HDOD) protein
MSKTTSDNAKNEILEIKHLPPLSITATRLLEAIGDPDVEVEDLAEIINHDPGLMGRIVGLANAAYFGQRNPITTVQEAIIRVLGINMVKSLALSISVSGAFQATSCPGFDTKEYWFEAIGCATMSRMMALRVPIDKRPDPDRIYLSGLLHNIGYLVLAHIFPSKLSQVFAIKDDDPGAILSLCSVFIWALIGYLQVNG